MDYRKIIIVGETNIGRSFMAECILRGILQKRNCQNIEVVSIGTFIDIDSTEAEEKIPKVTEEDPETYQQCFDILEPLMEAVADRIIGELLV